MYLDSLLRVLDLGYLSASLCRIVAGLCRAASLGCMCRCPAPPPIALSVAVSAVAPQDVFDFTFAMSECNEAKFASTWPYRLSDESLWPYTWSEDTCSNCGTLNCAFNRVGLLVARNAWCANKAEATTTYGDIGLWDVSRVTDLSNVFCGSASPVDQSQGCNPACADFNDDISAWDTSRATSLEACRRCVFPCFSPPWPASLRWQRRRADSHSSSSSAS